MYQRCARKVAVDLETELCDVVSECKELPWLFLTGVRTSVGKPIRVASGFLTGCHCGISICFTFKFVASDTVIGSTPFSSSNFRFIRRPLHLWYNSSSPDTGGR